jgi:hypothetical protein
MAQTAQAQSFETIDITRSDGTAVRVAKIDPLDGDNLVDHGELIALAEMATATWACHRELQTIASIGAEVVLLRRALQELVAALAERQQNNH